MHRAFCGRSIEAQMRMRRIALFALAVVAVLTVSGAAGAAGSGHATDACAARWQVVASGSKVPPLNAVAAISSTDVWAVGGENEDAGTATPVIVHWNGERLRSFRAFKPSGRNGELTAISAVSSDDVWAVGVDGWVSGRPIVMHWDGRGWRRVAIPRVHGDARLSGIAAMSSDDVWAVGWDQNGALVMHWDGRAWSVVGVRGIVGSQSGLSAVDGASPDDVWAVGNTAIDSEGPLGTGSYAPLSLHWDGRSWRRVRAFTAVSAGGDDVSQFDAVDVRSASDVWTLGFTFGAETNSILRWDGRRQRVVYNYAGEASLEDLAAVSPSNVWAVGRIFGPGTGSSSDLPFLRRWNGRSWRAQRTPLDGLRGTTLEGVAALSATEIWAAGSHLIARYSC